jgi:pyrroline-5-carboxylate reductase
MDMARSIFSLIGEVVVVDENLVDAVTAISGSGPAYFFYLIEALAQAAEKLGLGRDTAERLAVKTAIGSAKMLEAAKEKPSVLRARVTSKGGTTEAALRVFEAGGFKALVYEAAEAAFRKSKDMHGR